MIGRLKLPFRRKGEVMQFDHFGRRFYGAAGKHPDGRIGDVFLHSGKTGTQLSITMQDSAIAASLAIQYGCPISVLRKAFLRNDDNTAAGPLGHLFDLIADETPPAQAVRQAVDPEWPSILKWLRQLVPG